MRNARPAAAGARRRIRLSVAVLLALVIAVVAGQWILSDSGKRFMLKPATGTAQAMAVASERPAGD